MTLIKSFANDGRGVKTVELKPDFSVLVKEKHLVCIVKSCHNIGKFLYLVVVCTKVAEPWQSLLIVGSLVQENLLVHKLYHLVKEGVHTSRDFGKSGCTHHFAVLVLTKLAFKIGHKQVIKHLSCTCRHFFGSREGTKQLLALGL